MTAAAIPVPVAAAAARTALNSAAWVSLRSVRRVVLVMTLPLADVPRVSGLVQEARFATERLPGLEGAAGGKVLNSQFKAVPGRARCGQPRVGG
jgi:hypothetical protein